MPRQTIADAAAELLAARRAATSDELGRLVAGAGLTRAKSPTQALSRALGQDLRFRRLDDGRWTMPARLLDGVVLTHRATAQEIEHAALALEPDLAPFAAIALPGLQTTSGAVLITAGDEEARALTAVDTDRALKGPHGWLGDPSDRRRGQLLHVRLVAGRVEVSWRSEPDAAARMSGRRIVESARRALEDQSGSWYLGLPASVSLSQLLLDMLADDPDLLTSPSWPLGEIFDGAGLEVHRRWVGYAGTDWSEMDDFMAFDADLDADDPDESAWLPGEGLWPDDLVDPDEVGDDLEVDEALAERVAEAFGLEDEDVESLQAILGAYELHRRGHGLTDPRLLRQLAEVMADPPIAYVLAIVSHSLQGLEPFTAELAEAAAGPDAAGPRFLLAACAEARDDVLEAERRLRAALAADSLFEPAAMELARFEVDRGRFGSALRLLRDAGVPKDDPERAWLEEVNAPALPKVGRNEPCPCGSGRKYKVCHLGFESDGGSVEPARALLHKLWLWLEQPGGRRLRHDLMAEVVPHELLHEPDHDEGGRLEGPIVDDVVLFDRGELERFLRVRSELLPGSEQDLGRSWLTTRRSIYEVRAVRPGKGLTVRDLVTSRSGGKTNRSSDGIDGAEIELYDRSLSRQVEPLDLLCLRLVPDGSGGLTPSTGLLIPRTQRGRLIEVVSSGDPVALLRWVAFPNILPQLANMEGEPLRLVEATYRLPDPEAAASALRRWLEEDGEGRFVESVDRKGQTWIRGVITLEGDVARLQTNSTKRADHLERTLMRAAPGGRLIRREERSAEEAMEELRRSGTQAASDDERLDPAAHPEVAAAMDQMMRKHEERWVDESIPALGGMTPRQALADPRRRGELLAMLDDLVWQHRRRGTTATMDPARIRALLGL